MSQGNVTGFSAWRYLHLYREQLLEQTTLRVKWVIPLLLGHVKEGGMGRNFNYFLSVLLYGLTFFPVKMHDFDYHHLLSQADEHTA